MIKEEKYIFEEEKELNLENLKLLPINPRFTYFGDNFESFSIENIYNETFNKEKESKTLMKIFSSEENFEDSYELFESLIDNGYDKYIDRIWVIKNRYNNYYVLEGNRRTLFLKIILNINDLQNYFFENNEIISENICKNLKNLEEKNKCKNKNKKFFKKIKEKIKNYDQGGENINLSVYIFFEKCINNQKNECFNFEATKDKILKRLRNKHMIPNIKGKKDWNRLLVLKSYLDILQNYEKNNSTEKIIGKISKDYQISRKKVDRDLRSANWVNKLLNSLNENKKNKIIQNKNYKISAIEISPSTLRIINKEGKKVTLQKQIKLEYIKYKPKIKDENWGKIAEFLFNNFENGNFTTRGWKNEKEHYKLSNFFGEEEYNLKLSHIEYKEKIKNNEYIDKNLEIENLIYKIREENKKKIESNKNIYIYQIKKINEISKYTGGLTNIDFAFQNFKEIINWVTKYQLKWLLIPNDELIFSDKKNKEILKNIISVFAGLRIIFDYLKKFLNKMNGLENKNFENLLFKEFKFKSFKNIFFKKIKNTKLNFDKWLVNIIENVDEYDENEYNNLILNEDEFHEEITSWLVKEEKIKTIYNLNIKKELIKNDNSELNNNYNELISIWEKINEINFENREIKDTDWNQKPLRNYILHDILPILERIKNIDNREFFEKMINLLSQFLDKLKIIMNLIENDINAKLDNKNKYIAKIEQKSITF